jgi:hypothetical protein
MESDMSRSDTSTSRIVLQAPPATVKHLADMSDRLAISKVKALQLAVAVLHRLAEKIGEGATVVVREPNGSETEVWLPQIEPANDAPPR